MNTQSRTDGALGASALAAALFSLPVAFNLHPAEPVRHLVLSVVWLATGTAGTLLGIELVRPRRAPGARRVAAGIGLAAAIATTTSIALLVLLPREYTLGDIGITAAAVLGLPILLIASASARRVKT